MSDLLSIGSSGVAAYQRALTTVSNNISNVGTEGYVRQETQFAENMPRKQGRVYLGTGANVAGINRAYDQFLEQNLRNSTSELNTQGPMVGYANRIVDIMGSETVGLNNSLDKFFATARSLSVDPSSIVLRQQFLRDADGLAGGFRELSNQMTTVDTETRNAIDARIGDINTLASQIAVVNKQMSKHPLASRQPPDLLDQRDLLLTKLSRLVKINVTTAVNGAVDVSIGTIANAGKLVVGDRSTEIKARFDEVDLSRVSIILDPYSKNREEVAGVSSGELGGLMGFREQVLQPSFEALDNLARMVAGELNQIHANGIDLDGNIGQPLFSIDPVTRMDPVSKNAVQLDRASAGIRFVLDDPKKIAAGALFRVIENPNNLSGADAVLTYAPSYADPGRVKSLSQVLRNNPNPSAGINSPSDLLLGQIPLGANNWSVFLDNATDNQNIQVLTRDGRHLLGAPITDDAARRALLTTENGFVKGSTYSDTYLNESGETGYKQMSMFYGLKSLTGTQYDQATQFSPEHMIVPSTIDRRVITGEVIPANIKMIEADRLTVNGHVLPALYPTAPAQTIQASDIAEWMNKALQYDDPPIGVNAMTITPALAIDPAKGLYINGIAIPKQDGRSLEQLVTQLNSAYAGDTNIFAELNEAEDALILRNADGYGGNDIRIGGMDENGNITTQTAYRGKLNFGEPMNATPGLSLNPEDGLFINGMAIAPAAGRSLQVLKEQINHPEFKKANVFASIVQGALVLRNAPGYGGDDIWVGRMDEDGKMTPPDNYQGKSAFGEQRGITIGYGINGTRADLAKLGDPIGQYAVGLMPIIPKEARIDSLRIPPNVNSIAGNTLTLNGVAMSSLDYGRPLKAPDLAAWLNETGSTLKPPVVVRGVNQVKASAELLEKGIKEKYELMINGVKVTGTGADGTFKSPQELAAAINGADTGRVKISKDSTTLSNGLSINGVVITGSGIDGTFSSNDDLLTMVNLHANYVRTGVSATKDELTGDIILSSSVRINTFENSLDLSKGIIINGVYIHPDGNFIDGNQPIVRDGSFTDSDELVRKINEANDVLGSGVRAEKDATTGEIFLFSTSGRGIDIGPPGETNALGISSGLYPQQKDIVVGPIDKPNALGIASGTYSKVYAEIDSLGNLLISNGSGADISISTLLGGANVLGVSNGTYRGKLEIGSTKEIRFGFTDEHVESGPAELAKLGMRTGIYIDGAVQEDLLVFVSAGSGTITGSYDASMADPVSLNAKRIDALRTEKYDVTFTSEKQYQITWRNPSTGVITVLAEREYDPKQGIEYRGVHLMLNRPPMAGDTFLIDGNQDGTGNNQNILDIVALQTKGVIGGNGGSTISQAYEEQLGRVGNFASQAKIAQDALKVVNDQAIEARDKVSGVSLDSEAADLIRFQQAYQASAKTIQVSGDLFDAILQAAR